MRDYIKGFLQGVYIGLAITGALALVFMAFQLVRV